MRADVLHLVDATEPADRLFAIAHESGTVLRRRLDSGIVRLRTAADVRRRGAEIVVAWSPRALEVARLAGTGRIVYRPPPALFRTPKGGVTTLCHGEAQASRLGGDKVILPSPIPSAQPVPRDDLGVEENDFLWLLSSDGGPNAGLPTAIWAAALLYVLKRREGERHRVILPGDGPRHRQARRFVDQLGLPEMTVPVTTIDPARLAATADATLLTPSGPCDPWPARLAAAAGLPAVVTDRPEVRSAFDEADDRVRVPTSELPRHITREMLKIAKLGRRRPRAIASTEPEARSAWEAMLAQRLPLRV